MKYLLLYNPHSGRANFKSHLPYIINVFNQSEHELTIYESRAPKDLEKYAFDHASSFDVF